jgi:tetratricopeptide (TPR) repeat protein
MRFFAFLLAALLFVPLSIVTLAHVTVANAQATIPTAPDMEGTVEGDDLEQLQDRSAETLNSLFDDLRRQSNTAAANRISKKIWNAWNASGSDSIDLLMNRIGKAMNESNNNVALDLLDQVITLAPDFAEGWNRRATLHFAMKEYGRSLSDIERVLTLEPRHYGALSGLALILQTLGQDRKALDTWYKVLEIYPANEQAQNGVIKLEEKLSGNPT